MTTLPKDPVMLLSFTNMQLRDNYSSLDEFCKSFMIDKKDIISRKIEEKLRSIDYEYDSRTNQFI